MDTIYEIAELSINGSLVGLMYTLIALGIVLVFKSSGIANLAQGAIAMVGAYLAWAALVLLGAPVWTAIPLAIVAMYFVGRGIDVVERRGQREDEVGARCGIFGVPAVNGVSGESGRVAEVLQFVAAIPARSVSAADPRNAHAGAHGYFGGFAGDNIADNLVTGNET